jgi:D-glycero-alpha-D-manno-heptose-7-phosphate kinase
MEFYDGDKVIVNPLRIKQQYLFELENNLLLYYTSKSRESAKIIEQQASNVVNQKETSIEAMHQLKHQAQMMKEALLKGRLTRSVRSSILVFSKNEKWPQASAMN